MGDKPLDVGNWRDLLTANKDLANSARDKLKEELGDDEFNNTKFNEALSAVKKFYEKNDSKRKTDTAGTIISKIIGNYKSTKGKSGDTKYALPLPPYDFAKPFDQNDIEKRNIFYLIREAAIGDTTDELARYIGRNDYQSQYSEKRTIRVPRSKLKDNTNGIILPAECQKLKNLLDDPANVKNKNAITDEEIGEIVKKNKEYTQEIIKNCVNNDKTTFPPGDYGLAPAPKTDCQELSELLKNEGLVDDKKSITNNDIIRLAAKNRKYTRKFIEDCFKDTTLFPDAEYGLSPETDCEKLQNLLDNPEAVKNKKAITDKEIEKLTRINDKFTLAFIKDCIQNDPNFKPSDDYGFAISKECDAVRNALDTPGLIKNVDSITNAEFGKLLKILEMTRDDKPYIEGCFEEINKTRSDREKKYAFKPDITSCDDLKEFLDDTKYYVPNKKAITDKDIDRIVAVKREYNKIYINECFTAESTREKFPNTDYKLKDPPPETECEKLQKLLKNRAYVKDTKAITTKEIGKLFKLDPKYNRAFIKNCISLNPKKFEDYGFASSSCDDLKEILDDPKYVPNKKAITDEDIAKIVAANPEYTKDYIINCFTDKSTREKFPITEYGFVYSRPKYPPLLEDCENVKTALETPSLIKNIRSITNAEFGKLLKILKMTIADKPLIQTCFEEINIRLPEGAEKYAFAPDITSCDDLKEFLDDPEYVADKKAITDEDIARIVEIKPEYSRPYINNCFNDESTEDKFPETEYGFAKKGVLSKECRNVRNALETPGLIKNISSITNAEFGKLLKILKMTIADKPLIQTCFTEINKIRRSDLIALLNFPTPDEEKVRRLRNKYAFAPDITSCDDLKEFLDDTEYYVPNKKAITDEDIARIVAVKREYTKDYINKCFTDNSDTFKPDQYAFAGPEATPPPTIPDYQDILSSMLTAIKDRLFEAERKIQPPGTTVREIEFENEDQLQTVLLPKLKSLVPEGMKIYKIVYPSKDSKEGTNPEGGRTLRYDATIPTVKPYTLLTFKITRTEKESGTKFPKFKVSIEESNSERVDGGSKVQIRFQFYIVHNEVAKPSLPLTPLEYDSSFFERQESLGCGRHALNNLLGGKNFIKGDSRTAYDESNPKNPVPLQEVCKLLQNNPIAGESAIVCEENENYDTNVLRVGLNIFGFPVEQSTKDKWEEDDDDYGYVINFGGGHWVSLTRNKSSTSSSRITYLYKDSVYNRLEDLESYTKEEFLTKFEPRISQVLVVKKRRPEYISLLDKAKAISITQDEEQKPADDFKNAKLDLALRIKTVFDTDPYVNDLVLLSAEIEDEAVIKVLVDQYFSDDFLTDVKKIKNRDTPSTPDNNEKYLNMTGKFTREIQEDLKRLVEFITLIRKKTTASLEGNAEYKAFLQKVGKENPIYQILDGSYTETTPAQRNLIESMKGFPDRVAGGGKGPKPEKSKDVRLDDIGDLIDYTKAYEMYGLKKSILKDKLKAFIKLETSPGDTIPESQPITTNTSTKPPKQESVTTDTSTKPPKKESVTTDTSTKPPKQESVTLFNKSGKANNLIFESDKKTDDEIIDSLKDISKIGIAINQLIEKIRTIKIYIDKDPKSPVSLTELENLESSLIQDAKKDTKDNVNFNVTPLQYAVLVGNKGIIEALIRNNVPIDEKLTRTDPSVDGTVYTLETLAASRDERDPRKKDVLQLVIKIREARNKAVVDFESGSTPQKDEKFLKDPKTEQIPIFVYNKVFQEYLERKGGPNQDVIDVNIIRFADIIKKAKEDANKVDSTTKTYGIPDLDFYKPLAWNSQSPGLPAASAAYTKYYDIELAKIKGTQDGKSRPAIKSVEYDGPEYKKSPLLAVRNAYITAFNIASASDYDRGFYDGLAAKPVSEYISGTGFWFLEPEYSNALLESADPSVKYIPGLDVAKLFKVGKQGSSALYGAVGKPIYEGTKKLLFKTECETLKKLLDNKKYVEDKKAITKNDISKLTAKNSRYTRKFIEDCFKDSNVFPKEEYGFAPPLDQECINLKKHIEEEKVKDVKSITNEELYNIINKDSINYTREYIEECFKKNPDLFKDYKLEPEGAELKKLLDNPDQKYVKNKKAITDEEIANNLSKKGFMYTREYIEEVFKNKDLFPEKDYGLQPKCIGLKEILDNPRYVKDRRAITSTEVDTITKKNKEYTQKYIEDCFKNTDIFPVSKYKFETECEIFKKVLDNTIYNKKAITESDIRKLTAKNSRYTRNYIEDCFKNKTLFPENEYIFKPPKETPSPVVRDKYKQGYYLGITQFLAPNNPVDSTGVITSGYYDTIKEAATRAGTIDAENGYPKYTTPATYIAADTRASASGDVDRSKKDIPVQVFLNKLIKNYTEFLKGSSWTPSDFQKANREQEKINKLNELYNIAYQTTKTKKLQEFPTPPPAPIKPGVSPSSTGKGRTRKRKTRSSKRRTLRKK